MTKDFSGQNLQGRSFKGDLALVGANFSNADIRGANFSNANLTGAKFVGAKAGLQPLWIVLGLLISWIAIAFSGLMTGLIGAYIGHHFRLNGEADIWIGLSMLTALLSVSFIYARKGIAASYGLAAFALLFITGVGTAMLLSEIQPVSVAGFFSFSMVGGIAGTVTFVLAGRWVIAIDLAIATISAVFLGLVVAAVGATPAAVAGAIIITLGGGFLAYFVGWQALAIYSRNGFPWSNNVFVWKRAIAIAAWKGTRFDGANLTDVDFTNATLKHTDLRKARLTRTCFRGTRRLDYTQVEETYLKDYQIRQLAVTPEGPHLEANFDRFDLRGINLSGANLQNVSFIGADLSQANLQDANLSGAKLVQTQLDRTNLTGAILTGACIEDWGITAETQLDGIECKYVFMQLSLDKKENSSDENPHRKPDDWNRYFEDGEFVDFIKPMVQTLDLYHNRVEDPRLIAIAFNQLCEKYPDAGLEIISMEKKGRHQQGLLIRANTHPQADRDRLHSEYFENYDYLKGLPPQTLQHLLVEKDRQIKSLEGLVKTAMNHSGNRIYAQNYYNQGDTVMTDNRHIHMGDGDYNEINNPGTSMNVKGNYYNNPEQQKSLAEAAAEIQQLLEQLDKSNPAASTYEKMVVAAQAVEQIEKNPKLLNRVMSALRSGSLAALEASLEHPAASFVINALKDWKQDDR